VSFRASCRLTGDVTKSQRRPQCAARACITANLLIARAMTTLSKFQNLKHDTTTLLKSFADSAHRLPPKLMLEVLGGRPGDSLWGLLSALLTMAAFRVKVGSGGSLHRGIRRG